MEGGIHYFRQGYHIWSQSGVWTDFQSTTRPSLALGPDDVVQTRRALLADERERERVLN